MSSKFYQITVPDQSIYNTKECMIQYFVKKYGFTEFLSVIASRKFSNNEYLVNVPNVIAEEFINSLKEEERCTIKVLNSAGGGYRSTTSRINQNNIRRSI